MKQGAFELIIRSTLCTDARHWVVALLSLCAFVMLAGCGTPSSNPGTNFAANPRVQKTSHDVLAPGDVVEVYVVEDDTLNGRYEVRAGGHLIFPKIGKIQVAGRTSDEVESIIKRNLETNQLRTATVMVERPAMRSPEVPGKTVFISGNVSSPGRRILAFVGGQNPTVYQAILEAGGFSRFADQSHVLITRRSGGTRGGRIHADIRKIRDGSAADIPVEDGDMVFVPEKAFGW